jgi:predicted ribonuclease YlaK
VESIHAEIHCLVTVTEILGTSGLIHIFTQSQNCFFLHISKNLIHTLGKLVMILNIGEPRRLYREVVLLTKDRNLRVKALARHVPVREVPDFMQWAGLG